MKTNIEIKDTRKTDVYIKDEGYADVRFVSDKIKQWAYEQKIPNSLASFGKAFCGEPVWNENTKVGLYKIGIKLSKLNHFT